MSAILIVLCMTVGWFSWLNADKNLEEHPKKRIFVSGNDFQINDFQEIFGIESKNTEIVGINNQHEKSEVGVESNLPTAGIVSAEKIFQKRPPDLRGIMWGESIIPMTTNLNFPSIP